MRVFYPVFKWRELAAGWRYTTYPHMVGRIAKRSFFLIDKQGIVRGRWIGEDLDVFPSEILLQAVRELVGKP